VEEEKSIGYASAKEKGETIISVFLGNIIGRGKEGEQSSSPRFIVFSFF